ncbi:hypothetical protein QJQ45_011647 [Haematococcus lacustris]|nr:hypothetical protein QJQ45_011647 [Haematococcus lacustris]
MSKTLHDCDKIGNALDTVWRDLSTWAEQWADAHGDPIGVNGVDPHFVLGVPRLFNDRAKKHYQPVMAAARVLDPVNFLPTRPRAQPLPPMKDLTPEEQEDVVHVVARLAEVSEAEARRELRRFESGTWHPEMTRVANDIMSMAEAGERDGRAVTIIAPASQRLTWWQLLAQPHFPALAKAALRLLSVHVSTCAAERNWSAWGRLFADALRSSMDMATAEKLVFIQTNDELATNSDNFDKYNGEMKYHLLLRNSHATIASHATRFVHHTQVAPDAAAEELDNFEMGAWDPDMTRVANIILRMTKATEIDGRTAARPHGAWGRTFADAHRNTLSIEKAEELVFIQANDELTNSNQRDQEKELAIELY